jgi:hypothetical protein
METSRYRDRAEAADYLTEDKGLKTSKNTLQKWATTGGGPLYRRFGNRAVYTVEDLDAWAERKLSAPRRTYKKRSNDDLTAGEVTQ